jgi:hypothetical protein
MRLLIFTSVVFTLLGCGKDDSLKLLSSNQGTAESVYLTHDQNDNPVVAWTERAEALLFSLA